jgi:hypothetical protein
MNVPDTNRNEYGLTPKEEEFCYNYIFVTVFNKEQSIKNAGYELDSPILRERRAKDLLARKPVQTRIRAMMDERDNTPVVDKLWIIQKLKQIIEDNDKNATAQIRALELLGKHYGIFADKQIIEDYRDPGVIAKEAFERSKKKLLEESGMKTIGEVKDNVFKLFKEEVKTLESEIPSADTQRVSYSNN